MIVSFIGHRKIENEQAIKERLTVTIAELITQGADTFLFGSRSEFNSLCWEVVTELQELHPTIKRISYTAPHETAFTSKEEREQAERFMSAALHHEVKYTDYEEAVDTETAYKANKNAYIMRNQEMIDSSDICVFYYNEKYLPPKRKASNRFLPDRQTKSGTAIAYAYAKQKKKQVINLYDN